MNFREAAPCSLSTLGDDCLIHPLTLDRHENDSYDDLFTNEYYCCEAQLFSSAHPTSTSGEISAAVPEPAGCAWLTDYAGMGVG